MDLGCADAGRAVRAALVVVGALLACGLPATRATATGITNAGSDLRDGWYGDQPSLSPALVAGSTFGQLWKSDVVGQVYAQPLVHDGHVIAVTESNHAYSFDAETGVQTWGVTLPHSNPYDPVAQLKCRDLVPEIGATATPVIDPATDTIYLTHKAYASGSTTVAEWWMDALDAASGAERPGFPVKLDGTADNAPGQTFNATHQLQRPGLLLLDGAIYAAFGSHCDVKPYQGWVFGVTTSGQVRARWAAVSSGNGAGIWQAGQGLMSDGPGRLFVATGNEGSPPSPLAGGTPGGMLGDAIVRLDVQPDGTLSAGDFFAPFDAAKLDQWDADFASGGITALRDDVFGTPAYPHIAVAVGKAGYVYLLNRDDLGGIGMGAGGGDAVIERVGPYGGVWSRPAVWPGDGGWVIIPTASGNLQYVSSAGALKMYRFGRTATGMPSLTLQGESSDAFGFGSSAPVVTSDGLRSGSALVWVIWTAYGDGIGAQLRAYDATVAPGQEPQLRRSFPIGQASKFNTPGVGNGRIYVGTRDGHLLAFGAPISAALDIQATTFPATIVGQSTPGTVTLTAQRHVVVDDVTASPSAFVPDATGLALPQTLEAGQTLDVPMTFAPQSAGTIGGTLTVTTANDGVFTAALTGAGQAAGAKLAATPPVVSFGGTAVGRTLDGTMTFANQGGQPLTIDAVSLPGPPFSVAAADRPATGTVIDPGQSIVVPVHFRSDQPGAFTDALTLDTTGGTATVGLSGTAALGAHLDLGDAHGFAFGSVAVGQSADQSVTLSNTGDAALTIMKSKPPTASSLAVVGGLDEGTTIAPGASRSLRVRFTPADAGTLTDAWIVTADDGGGVHEIPVSGTGAVPAPVSDPPWPPQAPPESPPADTRDTLTPAPVGPGLIAAAEAAGTVARIPANLVVSVARLSRDRRRVTVAGRAVPAASGALTVTLTTRVGHRTARRIAHLRLRHGRFSATLLLPMAARGFSSVRVTVRFGGTTRVRPATAAPVVVVRPH